MKTHSLLARIITSIAALVVASSVQAQNHHAVVETQLRAVETILRGYGFEKSHDWKVKLLGRGERQTYTLDLQRGTSYMLVGVCDGDCRDVDIRVYDDNGNNIGEDTRVNDLSVVRVTPRWSATFSVSVTVSHCRISVCFAGIGAFGS